MEKKNTRHTVTVKQKRRFAHAGNHTGRANRLFFSRGCRNRIAQTEVRRMYTHSARIAAAPTLRRLCMPDRSI